MPFFRRVWDETRGDEYGAWGSSVWYFETDVLGNVVRQMEVYARGPTLRYGPELKADDFGALADQPLNLADFNEYEVTAHKFNRVWFRADSA